jgi:hypothetical protein
VTRATRQLDTLTEKTLIVPRYAQPELKTAFEINNSKQKLVFQGVEKLVADVKASRAKAKKPASKKNTRVSV